MTLVTKFFLAILFLALIWLAGLLFFVRAIPSEPAAFPSEADGIVVYTGGGGNRISAGMALLQSGSAKRLLISGVNPEITRSQIAVFWPGDAKQFDCCVDLGLRAQSTIGNAEELDLWLTDHDFQSIILVTSDFHMQRSLLETRDRLPMTAISAYPVRSEHIDEHGRPKTFNDWRRVAGEYTKYVAVRARTIIS